MQFMKKMLGSALTWAKGYFSLNNENKPNFIDSVRFYLVLSVVLELIVESFCRRSVIEAFKFLIFSPYAYMFCSLIIFATLAVSMFLPFRIWFASFISVVWIGFGVTDYILQGFRVTPFGVNDLQLITSVARIFKVYLEGWQIILICVLVVLVVAGLVMLFIKMPKYKIRPLKALCVAVALAILIPVLFIVGKSTSLLSTSFPNLVDAYNDYGFPYCFVMTMVDRGVSSPDEYDDEVMDEVMGELSTIKNLNVKVKPNVIIVQLESFFNVNALNNIIYSENPIKNFDELKELYPSGLVTVPSIGAGTVNTEFEILSGMSLSYFGAGEYPYKTVIKDYTCETVAYNLMELGYSTHAIHNYEGTFYSRNEVYKQLGFETFTSMEYMKEMQYNASGTWPLDSILTEEILKTLDSTEERDFVFAVSVQAHGKYPPMDLPSDYTSDITVAFNEDAEKAPLSSVEAWEYYVNQIAEVDLFVKELYDAVMALEEETVIVFYGDHLPSLMISDSDLTDCTKFQTEYLIIDNYTDKNNADYGDLFAYQLSAKVLEHVGINNGILTKLHQNYSDKEFYQEWLNCLQYDMLGGNGKRYVYDGNFEYYKRMDSMKMGIEDIKITGYKYEDGNLYVYGENFTKWSTIVVDKKTCDNTIFIDENMLVVPFDNDFDSAQYLLVDQVSDDGVHLSSSNKIVLREIID